MLKLLKYLSSKLHVVNNKSVNHSCHVTSVKPVSPNCMVVHHSCSGQVLRNRKADFILSLLHNGSVTQVSIQNEKPACIPSGCSILAYLTNVIVLACISETEACFYKGITLHSKKCPCLIFFCWCFLILLFNFSVFHSSYFLLYGISVEPSLH